MAFPPNDFATRAQSRTSAIHSSSLSPSLLPTPTYFSAAALYDPPQHVLIHGRHGDDVCEYPGESSTPLTLAAVCVLSQQAGQVGVTEPLHSHVSLWIVATAVL